MTVCIIEAMKLMNEVTSHAGGVVCEILVHDGSGWNTDSH
jgi:biotin carboxyl carrier protein